MMSRVMTQIGVIIAARFEAIEGRLFPERPLRPPLRSDRGRVDEGEEERRAPKVRRLQATAKPGKGATSLEKRESPQGPRRIIPHKGRKAPGVRPKKWE